MSPFPELVSGDFRNTIVNILGCFLFPPFVVPGDEKRQISLFVVLKAASDVQKTFGLEHCS
jgi:hypothetical protein